MKTHLRHVRLRRRLSFVAQACALSACTWLCSSPHVVAQGDPAPAPREVIPAPPPGSASAPAVSAPAVGQPLAPDQLDALVAPIALYPDPVLTQALVASTYPLELVEAQQWLGQNQNLSGDALLDAAKQQRWDPSVQSLVALPELLKRMSENIAWTTALGNAFLAQQADVMDAVQRLRRKAKDAGKLESNEQQTVSTQVVEKETVVVIQPAKTEVVYLPVYNPALIWGPPLYPYPALYYPPPPPRPGAVLVSFGVGMMVGAAIRGGWGYAPRWGYHRTHVVVVNTHNTFVKTNNVHNNIHVNQRNATWQHNVRHRGSVPYANPALTRKYGSATRPARPSAPAENRTPRAQGPAPQRGGQAGAQRGQGPGPRGGAGSNRAGEPPRERRGGTGHERQGAGGFGGEGRGGSERNRTGGREGGFGRGSGGFGGRGGGGRR